MSKISVIVPIYNVEAYIRRCLESILAQTWKDFELLCVNDCTPDGSMAVVDELIERYPGKVRRIDNEKNLGLGASRDRGMAEARGEYLVFFDSVDYVVFERWSEAGPIWWLAATFVSRRAKNRFFPYRTMR